MAVWEAAARVAYDFVPERFWATEREDIRTKYLPATQTWVYEENGVLVAAISLLGDHIGGLFVAPSQQGKGIGTKLIAHAETLHASLTLDVFKQNTRALRFYEKYGFIVIGESHHEATGCTNLMMSLVRQGSS